MNKIGVGYASVTELEKKYVMDALDNARLSQGKYVTLFEKKFAEMHNQQYGVMCNSGTSALHIALETLKEEYGWGESSEVLVPAITFIATSNACMHAGLVPVFVDVDPNTYNIDPQSIEKHITSNTKAIIAVHAFGLPCEMDEICQIADRFDLKIIEDCAESHFATYKNRPVGSFGEIACFSTYVAHTITTGVGGIVLTNNKKYAEICRSLIAHGRACTCESCIASLPEKVCPARLNTDIDKRFMFVRIGYSYRVGELEGALGLAQLERVHDIMKARKQNAIALTALLKEFDKYLKLPSCPEYCNHTYMMYPIVIISGKIERDRLVRYLEENNIETRPMLPLINQPIYKSIFGDLSSKYPSATNINNNGFYVGVHHGMGYDEVNYIYKAISKYIHSIE